MAELGYILLFLIQIFKMTSRNYRLQYFPPNITQYITFTQVGKRLQEILIKMYYILLIFLLFQVIINIGFNSFLFLKICLYSKKYQINIGTLEVIKINYSMLNFKKDVDFL